MIFHPNNLDRNKFSFEQKKYNAGDLIFSYYSSVYFLASDLTNNAQKLGEIEKSSFEAFKSFFKMLPAEEDVYVKFSMIEPEEPIQPKFSPEVTYYVAIVAVVAGIILFAIIGFFCFFYYL